MIPISEIYIFSSGRNYEKNVKTGISLVQPAKHPQNTRGLSQTNDLKQVKKLFEIQRKTDEPAKRIGPAEA